MIYIIEFLKSYEFLSLISFSVIFIQCLIIRDKNRLINLLIEKSSTLILPQSSSPGEFVTIKTGGIPIDQAIEKLLPLNKSLNDLILLSLKKYGPLTNRDIAERLLKEGYKTNSNNFKGTISTYLYNFQKEGKVKKISHGLWGINE